MDAADEATRERLREAGKRSAGSLLSCSTRAVLHSSPFRAAAAVQRPFLPAMQDGKQPGCLLLLQTKTHARKP